MYYYSLIHLPSSHLLTIFMNPLHDPFEPDLDGDLLDLSINEPQQDIFNDLTLVGKIISDRVLNFRVVRAILTNA